MTIRDTGMPRRQWRRLQLIFAGAAALATLTLFGTARPDVILAAPVSAAFGGFAADDSDDQAQLQQQLAQQQLQQSMQQAEEQNEQAQQQFQQDKQQAQIDEQQANNP
jgi:Sec-independent protein translocase protein TatA